MCSHGFFWILFFFFFFFFNLTEMTQIKQKHKPKNETGIYLPSEFNVINVTFGPMFLKLLSTFVLKSLGDHNSGKKISNKYMKRKKFGF